MNFQARSTIWAPALQDILRPSGSFGNSHEGRLQPNHLLFFLTLRFLWTTASWTTPGSFMRYDRAESVCKITWRFIRSRIASGYQSAFRMAPGPGALGTVIAGLSFVRTRVFRLPRCMIAPHCSQRAGLPSSPLSSSGVSVVLSQVASSASTSVQAQGQPPNLIFFYSC